MDEAPDPDAILSLDEAAKLIPGATKDTLLRLARAGRLTVYRVGKRYVTTAADMRAAIEASRVAPKVRPAIAPNAVAASAALDVVLDALAKRKAK